MAAWQIRSCATDFYPRPPRGGRHLNEERAKLTKEFLSTPSARRATGHHQGAAFHDRISIHALREEGDRFGQLLRHCRQYFYPRPPRGGRPLAAWQIRSCATDFYPRPPRGGRRRQDPAGPHHRPHISIHALREEGDFERYCRRDCRIKFLSTPSARRATAKTEKNISAFVSL